METGRKLKYAFTMYYLRILRIQLKIFMGIQKLYLRKRISYSIIHCQNWDESMGLNQQVGVHRRKNKSKNYSQIYKKNKDLHPSWRLLLLMILIRVIS